MNRCKECGSRLVADLYKGGLENKFVTDLYPTDYPSPHITLPKQTVHKRNDSYIELAQFAAWVCGVKIDDLSRGDMTNFIFQENERRQANAKKV